MTRTAGNRSHHAASRRTSLEVGCTIDLFEHRDFTGAMRRLHGPAVYPALRCPPRSKAGTAVESLIAGPRAYVLCFAQRDPRHTGLWLTPGDRLGTWPSATLAKQIDSFRIISSPPKRGEVGYEQFVKQRKRRK